MASSVNHRQSQEKVQIINSHPSASIRSYHTNAGKWQSQPHQLFSTNHDGVEKLLHNSRNFYPPHHFIMNTPVLSETNIKSGIDSWCLKITEKVSFNIASEASYVYILSGQKLVKNAKK